MFLPSLKAMALLSGMMAPGRDLYLGNAFVTNGWYGYDLATLVMAIPVLVAALLQGRRGSSHCSLVTCVSLPWGLRPAAQEAGVHSRFKCTYYQHAWSNKGG